MFRFLALAFLTAAATLSSFAATPDEIFTSIRNDDRAGLARSIAAGKEHVNTSDSRRTTPLHYAAVLGSVESIRMLLDAGADVHARNAMEATPLILAAPSAAKLKLLIAKGADVNASSKSGRTALMVASSCAHCEEPVRLLLKAGSKVDVTDELGSDALMVAESPSIVRLLLAHGAKPNISDKRGFTALHAAIRMNDTGTVRLLLRSGADVNAANHFANEVRNGKIALTGLTPLILAAPHGSVDLVRALLSAGAKVDAKDGRGLTPLMAAISGENQNRNVIDALLAAGANVNTVDTAGESVLDWARKVGNPATIRLLEAAGAKEKIQSAPPPAAPIAQSSGKAPMMPRPAVEQAMRLLQASSTEFFKQSGCVGCHHQPVTDLARKAVNDAGIQAPPTNIEEHVRSLLVSRPLEPMLLQLVGPGGGVDNVGALALGLHASGTKANPLTDAIVHYLAANQTSSGGWISAGLSRSPMEESNITRSSLAVRVLRAYGWPARQAEFDERIERARSWMLKAEPRTTYERAELLLGLQAAGASASDLARVAARLSREQQPSGGWSQNRYLSADAYATGIALHALHETRQLRASDPAYKRGVDFLLKTQLDDGSWHVRSRSPKFQPYFQSGFPHDHDQWISAAATAYAVMAIAPAVDTRVVARAER
jgi:ankyrin repeat protein